MLQSSAPARQVGSTARGAFPEEYLRRRLVTGTPTEVTERLARFVQAG